MKRLFATLVMAVAITGLFVMPLAAQSHAAVADIPFSFVVGDRTMPAGAYRLDQLNPSSSIFQVADHQGKSIFATFGKLVDGNPEKPSLTFVCYGKEHILAKVTPPFSNVAYELSKKALDRRAPRSIGLASMVSIKLSPR